MEKFTQIYEELLKKTNNGNDVPVIDKNGVSVHKLTIFEDIVLRNLDNLDTIALEINGNKLTYREFIKEVEKYMSSFKNLGLKEHDVVSLCLPVGVEFICSYFALTTLGITCNALNVMFLLPEGIKPYLDERCSHTLICDENYYKLLLLKGSMNDNKLKTIIIAGDSTYTHLKSDSDKILIPGKNLPGIDMLTFDDFLKTSNPQDVLRSVEYDENRIATLNYTSGTTGIPKCMGHSDLAPLFLVAAHDNIIRDEHRADRTLVTIPLQHPTGLFYSMVFQMAQGKTLVLEPRYDKRLFSVDIKTLEINHAVQAKPFYAQLIQDRADGLLKPGDFELFRNAYSGGEGIPLSVCNDINDTLAYAGCPNPLHLGYGRSEEGSLTVTPYNLEGRNNTCGVALPGIKTKIVDAKTLKDIPQVEGAKGEILVSTPVQPIGNCYLGPYNKPGHHDNSIVDEFGVRWSRPEDISTLVKLPDGTLSQLPLGRAHDNTVKGEKEYYLFDLKEEISNIPGIQECEVLTMPSENEEIITVHIVLKEKYKEKREEIIKKIYEKVEVVDAVRFYDIFGINATSGKCDREQMRMETDDYYSLVENKIYSSKFEMNEEKGYSLVLK